VSESSIYRYPLRRVVGQWTSSDGVLVEQLECGHDYARVGALASGAGMGRGRHCQRCGPKQVRSCARCGKLLNRHQARYCSRACFHDAQSAP